MRWEEHWTAFGHVLDIVIRHWTCIGHCHLGTGHALDTIIHLWTCIGHCHSPLDMYWTLSFGYWIHHWTAFGHVLDIVIWALDMHWTLSFGHWTCIGHCHLGTGHALDTIIHLWTCIGHCHSPLDMYWTLSFAVGHVLDIVIRHWTCIGHCHLGIGHALDIVIWALDMHWTLSFGHWTCIGHYHSPLDISNVTTPYFRFVILSWFLFYLMEKHGDKESCCLGNVKLQTKPQPITGLDTITSRQTYLSG
jgi:hypothetical protein